MAGASTDWPSKFAAEHELAVLVAAARNDPAKREAAWAQVIRIHPSQSPAPRTTEPLSPEDSLKMDLAAMLYCTLQRQGEAAAYDAAEREMTLPKLWRAAQQKSEGATWRLPHRGPLRPATPLFRLNAGHSTGVGEGA